MTATDDVATDRPESWPVHEVERIWDGPAPFSVRRDIISVPDRPDERFGRLVLEHPGAVVILAVDDRERVLVLHQYRHPAHMRFVELPAGLLDVEAEDPVLAAQRACPARRSATTWPAGSAPRPTGAASSRRTRSWT